MKRHLFWALTLILPLITMGQTNNQVGFDYLHRSFEEYHKIQQQIWSQPELGFLEVESSKILQNHLRNNGFSVQSGVAGMPTAFVATYGSGGTVIGMLAEFDALPGLSQDTVPYRKPIVAGGNGHACGHNLLGTGAVAGAIAIKEWLDKNKMKGTIKIFGSPAEEGGGGKVYLARDGFFNGVDIVLDWHPTSRNAVDVGSSYTAVQMIDYTFHGLAAHAAGSPDKGRSALDGVEAMNFMVNLMREHIPYSSRIHYVITEGGEAPNVVPDKAKVSYYIRHPKRDVLKNIVQWVNQTAEAAALGTQTQVEHEIISGFYEKLPNRKLAELVQKNLEKVGGVTYDDRELKFATQMMKELKVDSSLIKRVFTVQPLAEEKPSNGGGSTDVGDVSWNVPTVTFGTAAFMPGSAAHSWHWAASGGTTIGTKALINAAKVFVMSAIDLYTQPELVKEIQAEFIKRRGEDFKYTPLVGDRVPALDYRIKN